LLRSQVRVIVLPRSVWHELMVAHPEASKAVMANLQVDG
jgi:hypothetical protein